MADLSWIAPVVSAVGGFLNDLFKNKKDNDSKIDEKNKQDIAAITELNTLRLSQDYIALQAEIQAKYGGTLKPSMSGSTTNFNSILDKLTDDDIAKLNQYAGKVVGKVQGQDVYGKKYIRSGSSVLAQNVMPTPKLGGNLTPLIDEIQQQQQPKEVDTKQLGIIIPVVLLGALGYGGYYLYKRYKK